MTARSRGPRFTGHPLHAHACTCFPEDVQGRSGDALILGCNGGVFGDHPANFALVGPEATFFGFVGQPWLLLLLFCWFLLVPPRANGGCRLGVTGLPSAWVGEHSGLSPRSLIMLLWLVLVPVVPVLMRLLRVQVFMVLGSPLW